MSNPAVRRGNIPRISLAMVALLVAVGLLKLLFVANQEIVSEAYDQLNYVNQADHLGLSFGMRATGYVTWLWVVKALGMPQRIAIEILWFVCVAFLAFSVVPPNRSRWLVLPIFALAVFAPQTYYLFDHVITEGFYLCLSAVALGCSVKVFREASFLERVGTLVMLGLVFGIMAITRNEAALLFIFVAVWSVLVGIFDWTCLRHTFVRSGRGVLGTLAVVGMSAAIAPIALALHNGMRHGVFTPNVSVLPSNMKLLKALAEIETDEPNFRFVPVTRKARSMAYAQSPTLARFRSSVEDPKNIYQRFSLDAIGRPGEIGAGWIWHVFNSAAASLGITTYAELDATYLQAVREIEEGFASGKYRRRFVLHPFLGGDLSAWVPYLGEALKVVVFRALPPLKQYGDENLQPSDQATFDRVCMRRLSLNTTSVRIHGWVFSKNADFPISGVTIDDPVNERSALSLLGPRPDIRKGFQHGAFIPPLETDFDISTTIRKQNPGVVLSFLSGSEVVVRISQYEIGIVRNVNGTHGEVILGVDAASVVYPRDLDSIREFIKKVSIEIATNMSVWAAGILLSALCLIMIVYFNRLETKRLWLTTAAVFAVWASMHLLFYTILTAAAWEAEPRYMQNTAFFGFFFMVTMIIGAADHLVGWVALQRRGPASDSVTSC